MKSELCLILGPFIWLEFISTICFIFLFSSLMFYSYMHLKSVYFSVSPTLDSLKKNNAGDSFFPDFHAFENFAAWLIRDQLRQVSYQTCCNPGEKGDATYFCKCFTNFVELSEF